MGDRILIIGGGPAGYVAAIRAAQLGAEVALVEADRLGGVCTNVGCIPTKTYYHYAELMHENREAGKAKIFSGMPEPDWLKMLVQKDRVVRRLVSGVGYLLKKNRIELIRGRAEIIGPKEVQITKQGGGDSTETADHILIATGGEPRSIPVDGWDGAGVWDNTDALAAESAPESMLIVGGGVIGCEFAHIFASFGTEVTIVELTENLLPGSDPDISAAVTKALAAEGISIRTGTGLDSVERTAEGIIARAGDEEFDAAEILGSVGWKSTPPKGIEKAGIEMENGSIAVNDHLLASGNIYAAGDVTGEPYLAHRASAQGEIAVENMLGAEKSLDPEVIPGAIFTAMEIGSVGFTEPEAKGAFDNISTGKFPYRASGRAAASGSREGFAKCIANGKGRLIGIHIAGKNASEMLSAATLAIGRGMTIDDFRDVIIAHPTFGEILKESALDAGGGAIHI